MPGSQLAGLTFFHVIAKLSFSVFHRRAEILANRASPAKRASPPHVIGPLLTEREGRTGEYWPEVVAVQKRPRANIPQYGPEQVKLVSSLLYGIIFRTKQHFRYFIQVNFRRSVKERSQRF